MMKKKMFIACVMFILLAGCTPIVRKTLHENDGSVKGAYTPGSKALSGAAGLAVADVDYDKKNHTVFFQFDRTGTAKPAGKTFAVPHDFWDIAIALKPENGGIREAFVVSNSGSYGDGVRILRLKKDKTPDAYKAESFKTRKIQQVSFKETMPLKDLPRLQRSPDKDSSGKRPKEANPLQNALTDGRLYFLRGKKELFILKFTPSTAPKAGDSFTLSVTPCTADSSIDQRLTGFGAEYTVTGTISADYSFTYIKLGKTEGKVVTSVPVTIEGSTKNIALPKLNEWDMMFTRTNIYSAEMGDVFRNDGIIGTSAILLNTAAGTKAAPVLGWDFDQVTHAPVDSSFSTEIDAIGNGYANALVNDKEAQRKAWYYADTMPPTFYVNTNTYVVKCGDSGYGKFRPVTFYGSDNKKFYTVFRHSYTQ